MTEQTEALKRLRALRALPDIAEIVEGTRCCGNCLLAHEVPGTGGERWDRWHRVYPCPRRKYRMDDVGPGRPVFGRDEKKRHQIKLREALTRPVLCPAFVSLDKGA